MIAFSHVPKHAFLDWIKEQEDLCWKEIKESTLDRDVARLYDLAISLAALNKFKDQGLEYYQNEVY